MENSELIEKITSLVLERLNVLKKEDKKSIFVFEEELDNDIGINTHEIKKELETSFSSDYDINFWKKQCNEINVDKYDFFIISHLTISELVNISIGSGNTDFEKSIISCILKNKTIYVLNNELEMSKNTCNKAFYNNIINNIKILESYNFKFLTVCDIFADVYNCKKEIGVIEKCVGIKIDVLEKEIDLNIPLDYTSKKLLTEKDINEISNNSILNVKKIIITPSASDLIREKKIKIIKLN